MSSFIYTLVIITVVLSYLTMGVYYLWISLIAFFPKIQRWKELPYDEEMDIHFFMVIPCLNEEAVIANTVGSVLEADMKNLRLIVMDDDSRDKTVAVLEEAFGDIMLSLDDGSPFLPEYSDRKLILVKRKLPNAQKGKGQSLNAAYRLVGEIIELEGLKPSKCVMGVIDADTYVRRRVFERTAVIMHAERNVGMVQARIRIGTHTRDYLLPLGQDIEFFMYLSNMQNVREYTGTVSAAGNGQFNRFSAIDPEMPWTDCLLEDYDFSLRLLLKGWRTRLLQDDRVYQQGVLTYRRFVRQRSRWCQGGLQCMSYWGLIKNSPYISSYGKVELVFFMLLPFITMLAVFNQIISWFVIMYYLFTDQSIIFELMAPFSTGQLAAVLIIISSIIYLPGVIYGLAYRKDTKESLLVCLLAGFFQPIYNAFQVPAVIMAIWRQAIGKRSWIKTARYKEDNQTNGTPIRLALATDVSPVAVAAAVTSPAIIANNKPQLLLNANRNAGRHADRKHKCTQCRNFRTFVDDHILCGKKGPVIPGISCRKYTRQAS